VIICRPEIEEFMLNTILFHRALAALLCAIALASCSSDPEQQKRAYFESGNRYYEQKKLPEAIVEYRNAVKIDQAYGEAYKRLSDALFETGDVLNAVPALVRAADLLPTDTPLQLKTGALLLLSGRFDGARVRAEKVLSLDSRNVPAQILKANALAGVRDLEKALIQIEQAIAIDPKHSPTFTALGAVQVARGEDTEAETAFRRAIDLEPKSVNARLALGNFHWSRNRLAEAEAAFAEANSLEPRNRLANRALATFYLASGRAQSAEPFLIVLAEENRDPESRLSLADYYVVLNRFDDALKTLEPLAADRSKATDARLRIAAVKFMKGQKTEAYGEVDEILTKNPNTAEALVTRARFLIAEGKMTDALPYATRAVEADPSSAVAHHLSGTINGALKNNDEARRAFSRVLELNPAVVSAQIHLADLELRRGNTAASVQHAQNAIVTQPQNISARLVLAKSYVAEGNIEGAERELKQLLTAYPSWSPVHSQLGLLHLRRQNAAAARREFETALTLEPEAVEPLSGLMTIDVREGKIPQARARLEARLAKAPKDPAGLVFAARAYLLMKDTAMAEQMLKRAIEQDPSMLQAYTDLAQLYFSQGQLDRARESFERVAERQPAYIPARTMIGIIYQVKNQPAEAMRAYEQVMSRDKDAPVAANNLAWLYAEQGEKLEAALELAKTARQAMPGRAEVSDTLGYVYLRKNVPDLAVPILREAVTQDPANPRYRLRLGTALALSGRTAEARQEIEPLLRAHPNLPEAIEARAALAHVPAK
jgi:putative PEP-CTERM system TPR-repeat lipoprotein